ncbi:hypothetical protein AG1IA_10288 [Rhizoctonia solani AG-1 IA]|uniref:Uncharacterized protein n=1 Tax=Thanatephorus cucumeris (strain AG1-IA) TaxID=983506 RepID=L8WG39_THACA|nr:hypothetical protein AG1IA_10288 [Rhizoctonia solani AG-1 IA]
MGVEAPELKELVDEADDGMAVGLGGWASDGDEAQRATGVGSRSGMVSGGSGMCVLWGEGDATGNGTSCFSESALARAASYEKSPKCSSSRDTRLPLLRSSRPAGTQPCAHGEWEV